MLNLLCTAIISTLKEFLLKSYCYKLACMWQALAQVGLVVLMYLNAMALLRVIASVWTWSRGAWWYTVDFIIFPCLSYHCIAQWL